MPAALCLSIIVLHAAVLGIVGAALCWFGAQLLWLGGSAYYAIAGVGLVCSAVLLLRRDRRGYWLYALLCLATIGWALWEVGTQPWGMMARVAAPLVLLVPLSAVALWLEPTRREPGGGLTPLMVAVGASALLAGGWVWVREPAPSPAQDAVAFAPVDKGEWPNYGGDWKGDHHSPLAQITPANAGSLARAWTFRTGGIDDLGNNSRFTATPLAINGVLYLCDPRNRIFAVDGASGREVWRHDPKVNASKAFSIVCRGVSHHASAGTGECASRILEATLDARLIAVDAATGRPCPGFGKRGSVDLLKGVATRFDGYYYGTSPPAIIGDLAVIGGYVIDNQRLDPARSVVRAYDVRTGALHWVWDAGAPGKAGRADKQGLFSVGNPNAWALFTADPALGLVYVPTGNSSPDFYGALRTAAAEKYGTSLVALDAATGAVRWAFQAVHHDLWDYDMPAQPALVNIPARGGRPTPALILAGKTGQIFLLDRRSGRPLAPVEERPVPSSSTENVSPTQPYSSGLPSFAPPRITERAMWGATPVDMLLCRLAFRRLRYEGDYTPPSRDPFLFSPGTFGAINWGGVAIDPARQTMIVNSSNMPFVGQLVDRAEADAAGATPYDPDAGRSAKRSGPMPPMPMAGTPFGLRLRPFLSPIGFPCLAPPWGRIAGVDLQGRRLLWQRPLGDSSGNAPFGLALPVGIFNLGGAVTTGGGVSFIAATTDAQIRAFETRTGRLLWQQRLPAGGQATPISYAASDGRQMIVIVAGGHGSLRTKRGDYLVAFALPGQPAQRGRQRGR
ncbi:membrane-bound PQQ-dependent dehydrogenase, glucose/quinate/shikimate family [Rhizorhabdus sp. FW153]|uniref:membrane-bound PQQ-dependent dehydrogenase, glucose/quinate/shikimate family n=1 Tax=Rhizorhabdus sp. FW153 TaxID=3400216 RepID=UPI003CE8F539